MITRRNFLRTASSMTAAGALAHLATDAAADTQPAKSIRLTAAGGESGRSVKEGYIEPFSAKTGIEVVFEETAGTPLGKLRAMVESGNVDVVLHELGAPALAQAKALGIVEPLDWSLIDPAPMFSEAKDEYGLGYQYFSMVSAWRSDVALLTNWGDFWNVDKFPGKRALPDIPYHTLPIALLADGVPPDKIYPIDFDRAFASLERIKSQVQVWWTAGSQAPQLLGDNEIQYAAVYSGRVAGNPKFGFTFDQGLLWLSYFAVPKGAAEDQKLAAYKLLHEMTLVENQAVAAGIIPYSGCSPDLDPLLPQDRLQDFPTTQVNRAKQALPNAQFWYDNAQTVETRWQQFKLAL